LTIKIENQAASLVVIQQESFYALELMPGAEKDSC